MLNIFKFRNGLNIIPRPDGNTAPNSMGDLAVYSVDGKLYYNDGTSNSPIVSETSSSVLTGKTIDAGSNSISNITDANINAAAAIAFSKLASLSSAHILIGNSSDIATPFPITGDISLNELGVTTYTGIVPTSLGGTGVAAGSTNATFNALSPMTTVGDIIYEDATPVAVRLAIGSPGQVLTVTAGIPSWVTPSPGFANPMTNVGDLIIGSSGGSPQRLGVSTDGFILTLVSGSPQWVVNAGGGGTVTSVTASGPLSSSGGTTPDISFTGVLGPAFGGTGVANNAASTLTISGSFGTTLTITAPTSVTLPTSGTLATLSGTETLSNKTFSNAITINEISTPSTPSAGFSKIYFKADGSPYILNSNGTESILASNLSSAKAAIGLTTNYTSSGGASNPVKYDTIEYDNYGAYSVSTGIYTVPYTGDYEVSVIFYTLSGVQNYQLYKNGTGYAYILRNTQNGCGTLSLPCNAGDTLSVSPDASATFDGNIPFLNYLSIEQLQSNPGIEVPRSEVCVTVGNGSGSTNTFVRRWTNSTDGVNGAVNLGSAITYADDATLGATFTINETGLYAISYDESLSANDQFGVSKNQSVLTQAYSQLPLSEQVVGADSVGASLGGNCGVTLALKAGDIIRGLWGNDSEGATYFQKFRITQISNNGIISGGGGGGFSNPMTTGGDLIYGGASGTPTRLANGTNGQVLTSSGGTSAPTWTTPGAGSSGLDFFASSQVSTNSSLVTSTSYVTFSNSPTFVFTPNFTGTYEVYCSAPLESLNNAIRSFAKISNTVGSATLLNEQAVVISTSVANVFASCYTSSIYTLTASTSYTFEIQGKSESGGNTLLSGLSVPFYLFARRIG